MANYYRNGKKLTTNSMKEEVKQATGWTEKQYKRYFENFKNKLNTYYKVSKTPKSERQSASVFFYNYQTRKAQDRYYQPSRIVKKILSFPSLTPSQYKEQVSTKSGREELKADYRRYVKYVYGGLIRESEKAKEINRRIKDPYKKEQALKEYAEELRRKQRELDTIGSNIDFDFDVENYLK